MKTRKLYCLDCFHNVETITYRNIAGFLKNTDYSIFIVELSIIVNGLLRILYLLYIASSMFAFGQHHRLI